MISEARIDRWMKRWQEGPGYHVLLGLLLSLFVLLPVLDARGWGGLIVGTIMLAIFFQAFTVVCRHRAEGIVGVLLFLPAFLDWLVLGRNSLLPVFPRAASSVPLQAAIGFGSALFLFYLVFLTVKFIFHQRRVSWKQISAAAASYLLLGLAWRILYGLVLVLDPEGSFRGLERAARDGEVLMSSGTGDLLYFSFVTMTTLGYGDIVPQSQAAKMLVSLQAIVGQLFLVILVARLVGMVDGRGSPPAKAE